MAKKKQKKGLTGGEVILPRHIPSIWQKIDDLMKKKQDIPDDEIKFVENFVEKGDKILGGFGQWIITKRKEHGLHAKKWQDVKSYKLAWVL
jgi:hypothetical protein